MNKPTDMTIEDVVQHIVRNLGAVEKTYCLYKGNYGLKHILQRETGIYTTIMIFSVWGGLNK